MAFAARSLTRSARFLVQRGPGSASMRLFSVSPLRFVSEDPVIPPPPKEPRAEDFPPMAEYSPDMLSKQDRSMYDMMAPEERAAFDAENRRLVSEFNDVGKRAEAFADLEKQVNQIDKQEDIRFEDVRVTRGFWAEDDGDELAQVEDGDEEINDDEITSFAHAEMELHRETREYARLAAWDMPILSSKNMIL